MDVWWLGRISHWHSLIGPCGSEHPWQCHDAWHGLCNVDTKTRAPTLLQGWRMRAHDDKLSYMYICCVCYKLHHCRVVASHQGQSEGETIHAGQPLA